MRTELPYLKEQELKVYARFSGLLPFKKRQYVVLTKAMLSNSILMPLYSRGFRGSVHSWMWFYCMDLPPLAFQKGTFLVLSFSISFELQNHNEFCGMITLYFQQNGTLIYSFLFYTCTKSSMTEQV